MRQENRDYGVERWAADTFGWERTDGAHHDLIKSDGTPVEAKGCCRWLSSGDGRERGRFRLWSESHDELVQDGGVYLFVVYENHEKWEQPWAWRTVPAYRITYLVDGFYNYTFRPSKGETALLAWPHIMEMTDPCKKVA